MIQRSSKIYLGIKSFLWKISSIFILTAVVSLVNYKYYVESILRFTPIIILLFGVFWTKDPKKYGIASTILAILVSGLVMIVVGDLLAIENYSLHVIKSCFLGLIIGIVFFILKRVYHNFIN